MMQFGKYRQIDVYLHKGNQGYQNVTPFIRRLQGLFDEIAELCKRRFEFEHDLIMRSVETTEGGFIEFGGLDALIHPRN